MVIILLLFPLMGVAEIHRVGGDVKAPLVIRDVAPIYTEEARQARITGIVILETVIDHNGVVKDVRVLKPLPFGLSEAASSAVKQWIFKPATLHGEAVDVVMNLTINFKLDETPKSDSHLTRRVPARSTPPYRPARNQPIAGCHASVPNSGSSSRRRARRQFRTPLRSQRRGRELRPRLTSARTT
jgi:TonB family protein